MTGPSDRADPAAIIAAGSQSFARAARLLPLAMRADILRLYAWCRRCDDLIDGQTLGHDRQPLPSAERVERLQQLRRETEAALSGSPVAAGDHSLQGLMAVMRRHDIDPALPLALLDGFALDVSGARYATLPDTLVYCYDVAGAIGLMLARIMGVRDAATLDRACDLGLAFQLTNIARDLAEDARAGHVYAPSEMLRDHGLTLAELTVDGQPRTLALAQQLARVAMPYYQSAFYGALRLPLRAAWAILAARLIYRDIALAILAATGCLPRRVVTSSWRKSLRIVQAALQALYGRLIGRYLPAPSRSGLWLRP